VRRAELEIQDLEVKLGEQRARLIKRLALLPVWFIIALVLAVGLLANPDPVWALVIALALGGSTGLSSLAGKRGGES
jgi:dolichol kinase